MWNRIITKHTIQIRKLLQRPLVIVGLANGDRREGGLPLEEQGIWREADHGAALGQRQQQQVETPCWSDQHQDPEQPVSAWDIPIAYCVIRRVDFATLHDPTPTNSHDKSAQDTCPVGCEFRSLFELAIKYFVFSSLLIVFFQITY